ncbi:hypothetical protein Pcinc_007767 [Petrolisthes cinctipes]|uniref:Uncharacterized protein n=1 Tax=Petrolisthes cinctipes TaxID=88211 RepID=A0AAE1G8S5_PETCI|nr:hypothetical protein Pcinc_007767 [Petrolisthes cinctipes]
MDREEILILLDTQWKYFNEALDRIQRQSTESIKDADKKINGVITSLEYTQSRLDESLSDLASVVEEKNEALNKIRYLTEENKNLRTQLTGITERLNYLDDQGRRNNLRFECVHRVWKINSKRPAEMLPSETEDSSREPTSISMRTCALAPWRELGGGTGKDKGRRRQHLGHHSSTSISPTHRPSRTPPISPPPSHLTQPSSHTTPLPAHLTPTTASSRLPPTTPPRLSQRMPPSPLTLPIARVWAGVASGAQERSCDVEQRDQANTNTRAVKKKPGYDK